MTADESPLPPVGRRVPHPSTGAPPAPKRARILTRLRFFRFDWLTTAAAVVLLLFVFAAVMADVIAPYPWDEIHMGDTLQPPSAQYLLGTDNLGRDILSRIIYGSRAILTVSLSAALLGLTLGTLVGLISGYAGGWLDEIMMRSFDALLALPTVLLGLLLVATLGRSRYSVILAIGVVYTPVVARVVRSAVLAVKNLDFVRAARLRGESTAYVLRQEILANIWSPIIVEGSVRVSYAILLTASFGFLGLGAQEPDPDWGLMVSRARDYIQVAPWMALFPTLAISLLVVSLSLVADALQQRLGAPPSENEDA